MKRLEILIIVAAILVLSFQPLGAETVSASRAANVAKSFFSRMGGGTKAASSEVKLVYDGRESWDAEAPFYVFDSDNGFVVVAGDDGMNPVLGYSTTGKFDASNIPDGLKDLLESYRKKAAALGQEKTKASFETGELWAKACSASSVGAATVVKMETALWGQGYPYNEKCPTIGEDHCLTGCGATALAILMRYYNYPNQAYGTLPAYTTTSSGITVPAKVIDYSYDWGNMPLSSFATQAQIDAVSTLMADIGQMIQADYGLYGTSSYTNKMLPGMLEHMKYSNNASMRNRANYSTGDWLALLQIELDAGHPVLYRGDNLALGGHFYVIDGYDNEDRLHFNWGWGGSDNGFFFVSDTDFSSNENAIVGLVPDYGWSAPTSSSLLSFYNDGTNYFGLWCDDPYIENGDDVTVHLDVINQGTATYTGKFLVGVRHSDGSVNSLYTSNEFSVGPNYIRSIFVTGTMSGLQDSDELIACYLDADNQWRLIDYGTGAIPLRYDLRDAVSLQYRDEGTYKCLLVRGKAGMTISGGGVNATFSKPVYELVDPQTGDYTFSNGHDSFTVHLTF